MQTAGASLNGLFGLAAIVGGLFCKQLKTALIVGLGVALAYAALVVLALGGDFSNVDMANFLGRLVGAGLMMIVFAVLAYSVRRGIAAFFRRKQAS
jgi:hypothetical protein